MGRLGPVKTLALLGIAAFATGAAPPLSFSEQVLQEHNLERATLGIDAMTWDENLERDAREWALHLAQTNQFKHYNEAPGEEPQGENLWAGTKGYFGPKAMVGLWISEKRHYRYGRFPNNSTTGDVADVGHYTQLIWAETGRVGCAVAQGRQEDILVCRYSSAGNVIGEVPA